MRGEVGGWARNVNVEGLDDVGDDVANLMGEGAAVGVTEYEPFGSGGDRYL